MGRRAALQHAAAAAWSDNLLDQLPGAPLKALPLTFGRRRYRTGFVARRSAEDLAPFRHLEAAVRDAALHPGRRTRG